MDLKNEQVNQLFQQTKLSKFLDGLTPELKKPVLLKDPKNFQEALNFVELVQNSEDSCPLSINNVRESENSQGLEKVHKALEQHAQLTHECISALSQQIHNLQIRDNFSPQTYRNSTFGYRNFANSNQMQSNFRPAAGRGNYTSQQRSPAFRRYCDFCRKAGHTMDRCFYHPQNTSRTSNRPPHAERSVTFRERPFSHNSRGALQRTVNRQNPRPFNGHLNA